MAKKSRDTAIEKPQADQICAREIVDDVQIRLARERTLAEMLEEMLFTLQFAEVPPDHTKILADLGFLLERSAAECESISNRVGDLYRACRGAR